MGSDAAEASARAHQVLLDANQARQEALTHKRAAGHHRRQARNAMRRLETFVADLESMGITVKFDNHPDPHEEESQ